MLHWCYVAARDAGKPHYYEVAFALESEQKELATVHDVGTDTYAVIKEADNRVVLWAGIARGSIAEILMHEILHLAWNRNRGYYAPPTCLVEERTILAIQRDLTQILGDFGFAFPALPEGLDSLRRKAQRERRARKQKRAARKAINASAR